MGIRSRTNQSLVNRPQGDSESGRCGGRGSLFKGNALSGTWVKVLVEKGDFKCPSTRGSWDEVDIHACTSFASRLWFYIEEGGMLLWHLLFNCDFSIRVLWLSRHITKIWPGERIKWANILTLFSAVDSAEDRISLIIRDIPSFLPQIWEILHSFVSIPDFRSISVVLPVDWKFHIGYIWIS